MILSVGNRLRIVNEGTGKRIYYLHPFRVDVEFYVAPRLASAQGLRDWDVIMVSKTPALVHILRQELCCEFCLYLKARVRDKNLQAVRFQELEDMACIASF